MAFRRSIASSACLLALTMLGCALPRERTETFARSAPDAAAAGSRSDGPESMQSDSAPAPSAPVANSPSTPSPNNGNAAGAAAPSASDAGAIQPAIDAGVEDAAKPDECGDKFWTCVITDALNFEKCAKQYCSALAPAPLPVVDAGTTPEAMCASQLAECISRDPQNTATCMSMLNACMMRD